MKFFSYEEVDSTQDKALELLKTETPPFIVTTQRQRSGRGRMDRKWFFEPGRSLAFSLTLTIPAHLLPAYSLVVGFEMIHILDLESLKLKWPNDLMKGDQKVGGILIHSRSSATQAEVTVGVGLNLKDLESAPYTGLNHPSKTWTAEEMGTLLWERLQSSPGFLKRKEQIEDRLWGRTQNISLKAEGEVFEGRLEGLDAEGRLVLNSNETLSVRSDGEIIRAS